MGLRLQQALIVQLFIFIFRIQYLYSTARLQELLTSYTTTLYVCSEGIGPHTAPISLTCPTTSNCLDTYMTILSICRELTTLWVARLDEGTELKVTDPKEQQGDVEEE